MIDINEMPGFLVRRFQQIAVAIFLAEAEDEGFELTPVQFAALTVTGQHPGLDQATLAGMIAYDRTTIGGVVDRLVQKGLIARDVSDRDRRARELRVTEKGRAILRGMEPAVRRAQRIMLAGLSAREADQFLRLLRKAIAARNDLSRAPLRDGLAGATQEP